MKIRVSGCSEGAGDAEGGVTTSFLVDDDILIDAGTGVGALSLSEMKRIMEKCHQCHQRLAAVSA